jgi:hypothetical protein
MKQKEAVDRYWEEEVSRWRIGQHVWCNSAGLFLGSPVQRGTEYVVVYVQPRARRVWLAAPGREVDRRRWLWFSALGLCLYNFRPQPPDNPVDPRMAAVLGWAGHMLEEG